MEVRVRDTHCVFLVKEELFGLEEQDTCLLFSSVKDACWRPNISTSISLFGRAWERQGSRGQPFIPVHPEPLSAVAW